MLNTINSIRQNRRLIFFIKCLVSLLVLYWVVQKGDMSFKNIKMGLFNISLFCLFLGLTFCQLLLGVFRMYLLMQFKTPVRLIYGKILSVIWASSFVASIAPSSLFGEAFRIRELIVLDSTLNTDNSFYAAIFTKIFSILGLILIAVFSSVFIDNHSQELSWIFGIFYVILILAICTIIFRKSIINHLKSSFAKIADHSNPSLAVKRVQNFLTYNTVLIKKGKSLFSIAFISFLVQVLNTASFVIIIYAINPNLSLDVIDILYVIPVGILIMTIPISISGLGIGHVAFSQLLGLVQIPNGADVFTIFFAFSYVFNFLGLLPFILLFKKD